MLSELCRLHSLGRQHNTLDTVRESGLKWENWKNTYFFLLQDLSRREKCFPDNLRGKVASLTQDLKNKERSVDFQKVLRCLLCLTSSPTFLVFDVLDNWEHSCSVLWRVSFYWGLSHGFITVRLGWGGWIWWARLQWWIDLLVISYQGYTITWFTVTDVDLDHLAEVSWVLPCQVMPHLLPPLDFSPTGIPLLSPSYIQDHLCIPVPPLVASCALKTPHSPHPVPVMHHVIIISRTKITWSHDQRPSTIISTQTQTSLGK